MGGLNVTVFALETAEQLTEHPSSRTAVVRILPGRVDDTVDAEHLDLGPRSWLRMEPGAPNALMATEPTVMLLTLIEA